MLALNSQPEMENTVVDAEKWMAHDHGSEIFEQDAQVAESAHLSRDMSVVLIDDDPLFNLMFRRTASESQKQEDLDRFHVDTFTSVLDIDYQGWKVGNYDCAVVDRDLGCMDGADIVNYVEAFFGDIPIVLITGKRNKELDETSWPGPVNALVHKQAGIKTILNCVQAVLLH